jgi:RHS repeat-associated protein
VNGNVIETKTLFPTRNYAVFSGTFTEPGQTAFEFDLTGLTITDGILVISSIAVPTPETLYETHSEPGRGFQNTGSWQNKYFMADYHRCTPEPDCFDGQIKIGPFEHYPGSPDYTGYTTWIDDNTQYVETSYSKIINEYPEQPDYNLNTTSWIQITDTLGSGTTSATIPAADFVQGVNTLYFQENNTYPTKFDWTLYINQGITPEEYITGYTHDTYGNTTSITNAEGHTTTFEYSADYHHAYLTSRTDMVDGQEISVSTTYDFTTGNQTSRTCACGSTTDYEYDSLGRLTRVIYPLVLGEQERAEYKICYNDTTNTVTLYNETDEKTVRYYDGLGRMIKEEIYKETVWAQWLYEYNYLGKPSVMTDPLSRQYRYEYDSKGRATKFVNPDHTFRTTTYDDETNTATVKDENLHTKEYTLSWTGDLLSVKEYHDTGYYLTEYTYDETGNLVQMRDPEQHVTTYMYDSIFGITAVLYPDSTEKNFFYDNTGNMIEMIDQNGNHITYTYDAVSRLTHINYGDTSVSFTYDPAGNKTSVITPDTTTYYGYDARNRLLQTSLVIDGTSYSTEYQYDPAGNITQITYPDGTVLQYTYSFKDQIESIQGYASFSYLPDGTLETTLYMNGVTTDYTYHVRGTMHTIHAYTGADLLELTYEYDPAGNITQIENNYFTALQEWVTWSEVYTYDTLDRLVSAANGFGSISYAYDSKKRVSVDRNGENTPYTYGYDLLLSAGEHTFTYDSNGNTLTKSAASEWVYHYNTANQLTRVDRDNEMYGQYTYDGNNKRVKKTEWSENLQDYVTTTYIYSGSTVIYEESTMGTARHVYGPSGRIAKITTVNGETHTFYCTGDHLGSVRLVTDENGTPLTSVTYYPFGEPHQYSGEREPYLFTGKERDETGLYYFNARYYDPETGRFLTRDPYTFQPDDPRILNGTAGTWQQWLMNPQRFDRFSYAGSNPLKNKDPTGLSFDYYDPECRNLLVGDSGDSSQEEPHGEEPEKDDDGYDSRQEECQDCDCMEREDIKALRSLKNKLYAGEIGIAIAYGLLCALIAAVICLEAPPLEIGCITVSGVACAVYFGWVTHTSMEDTIDDIDWAMKKLGCDCATYCDSWG